MYGGNLFYFAVLGVTGRSSAMLLLWGRKNFQNLTSKVPIFLRQSLHVTKGLGAKVIFIHYVVSLTTGP